jgi:hypothetical protein
MDYRGRQRTNNRPNIRKFYKSSGQNVYGYASKQKRAASPQPLKTFTNTQSTINVARRLQKNKSIVGRAPSPTRNGAEQRNKNEARIRHNIHTYRSLTGESNNTSQKLKSINNEPMSLWDRVYNLTRLFGGSKNKRSRTKRNRTKRNRAKRTKRN